MKDIKGYEGLYAITEDGRVWSHKKYRVGRTGRWMSLQKNPNGYLVVKLRKREGGKKEYRVHRLVAMAYLEGDHSLTVNHKNFLKEDNRVENLEWISERSNHKHAVLAGRCSRSGLTEEKVKEMRMLHKQGFSYAQLQEKYSVHNSTISLIINRRSWSWC